MLKSAQTVRFVPRGFQCIHCQMCDILQRLQIINVQQFNTMSTNRTVCLDLFAINIKLSMSVKTNLHITVRTCQIERKKIHLTTVGCYQRESCIETIFLSLTGELYISGARFSKVPVTFRARNQTFKSKYKE